MALSFAFVPCGTTVGSLTSDIPVQPLRLLEKNFAIINVVLAVIQNEQVLYTSPFEITSDEKVFWNKTDGLYIPPPPEEGTSYRCVEITPAGVASSYVISWPASSDVMFSEKVVLYNHNL